MASPASPSSNQAQQQSRLARILVPALDKIVKNAAWRKHSKLVQECKAATDRLVVPVPQGGGGAAPDIGLLFDGSVFIPVAESALVLQPLITACDTGSLKVVEPALDALQKIISHGHLCGEVDTVESSKESKLLYLLLEGACKCHDLADDATELLVLKTLLTAVMSVPLRVHGECLLKAVRTCYNIYLGSKVGVNQSIAKACLIQMLIIVFRRMEADSSSIPVQAIVVADLMEPSERSTSDSNITQFVQNFITKVMQDIEVALNPSASFKSSIAPDGAFNATAVESPDPTNVLEPSDKDMLDGHYWDAGMYKNVLEERKGDLAEADLDRDGDLEVHIANKLRRDAFLIFRAVCKLSMKSASTDGASDPLALRGKIVSLELLKILLENAGTVFRTNERFLVAIKQYLCLSLLKNSASSMMNIFQLSCSIFMSLMARFRAGLKAEIGVFFPMIVLRVLEAVSQPNFLQKMTVLRFLEKLCVDSQILMDIFVNYDCDVESSNIFERMVNGLLKNAQGVPPNAVSNLTLAQDGTLKLTAMKCLVGVLRSMGDWMNRQLRITDSNYQKTADSEETPSENASTLSSSVQDGGVEEASETSEVRSESTNETSEAATFEQRRAYKLELQEGILQFNRKPRKGIEFLVKNKKVGNSPEEIASFLKNASGLDKTIIGDYLGENEELALKVMHAYVDSFEFQDMEFDEAIRTLLLGFRLPGEAQKIDRIMEKFAERYCKCNPKRFTSADTAYVLAYSVILLNTDAHNPTVKNKMSKLDFFRNNRGIDDGKDLPEDFMGALYDRIVKNEIKMKEDTILQQSKQTTNINKILGLDAILNIVIRKRMEDHFSETSDDVIRHMQEQFKAKAGKSESVHYSASDVATLRPMMEVSWAPMLAAFSVPLDQSEDEVITSQCLEGYRHAVHITSAMCMQTQRDAFLTSLAKFTSLHSVADIKQKNIDAIKAIVSIADEDGNFLQDSWEHILTCVSRFEHLHLLGEGAPPDATFFGVHQNDLDKTKQPSKSAIIPVIKKKGQNFAHGSARRGSYDGAGGYASGVITTEQMKNLVSNLNMLEQIGSFEMNRIFTRSVRLNSEAIVDFVRCLCKVSLEELRSPTDPRVFSLTKIVEIAHFNMNRIRLVWSRIWHVLSDFFINVGCSDNLSIAIFAMDSLRQLAMKFLEREELVNYNFQNEFMKPFAIVMRKSRAVEIRELIIRCVSQMVLSRVNNVRSGWKIMFMVFTTAATDDHKNIVLLAFETIEKIVREYFPYITETETTTFTDCVNCLIAFTNSRFNKDVSLNAIAFLRFCALKLAEGELGAGAKDMDKAKEKPLPTFTDKDDHLYFWFPLLAGLSELTFDPRPDIRKSALEVLFDTLRYHGHLFSPGLWEKVFDSVLFPIFDYVRRATDPDVQKQQGSVWDGEDSEGEVDAWLYETCTVALQLVVDLFVKFYTVVNPLLVKVLQLLTGFIKRSHQSLAAIGVAAFVRLIGNAGSLFSDEKWFEVLFTLKEAATETLPDLTRIIIILDVPPTESHEYGGTRNNQVVKGNDEDAEDASREGMENLLELAINDVKSRTAVQLLIVQAISEIYNSHGERLKAVHTKLLLDALHDIAVHSHKFNCDYALRAKLHKVQSMTQMPDPPLLRLESESYQAYLALLQHLPLEKPALAKQVDVETRLVELCEEVLQVYLSTATFVPNGTTAANEKEKTDEDNDTLWLIPLGSSRRRELVARAPLVVSTLQAISGLKDTSFEKYLARFFPLLASLISCEHGSGEVQLALSDMFGSWIGPILLQAIR